MVTRNPIFNVSSNVYTLVEHAAFHFKNPIIFSSKVRCPEDGCTIGPFPDSEFLYLHIFFHKELNFMCGFCPNAFKYDCLLTKHFTEIHSEKHQLSKHLESKIDIYSKLTEKMPTLNLGPDTDGSVIICKYRNGIPLFSICKFPQTALFLSHSFDVQKSIRSCFNSPLVSKMVKCPLKTGNDICGQEFETCRELVLHIGLHFSAKVICTECFNFSSSMDWCFVFHINFIHSKCVLCNCKFDNYEETEKHTAAINRCLESTTEVPDLNIAPYLPNLAFHHANMRRITVIDAHKEMHSCLNLNLVLQRKINKIPFPRDGILKVQTCLRDSIIVYSEPTECTYKRCTFTYTTCRELLVHVMFCHVNIPPIRYLCMSCHLSAQDKTSLIGYSQDKESLEKHIKDCHKEFYCLCLMPFSTKLSLAVHQHTTGHLPKNSLTENV